MLRRNFLKSAAVASVAGTSLLACSSATTTNNKVSFQKGTIVHSVYFWLKENITQTEEQDFLNFFKELSKIPGIKELHYATPAPTTERDVVDNSFSYHLMVTFDTMDDINIYENHPDHLVASDIYSKYWDKVLVMDSII